ncbi:MAG: outer membrane beta-barrel protein [Steroidobacteraceae bacterium]|jgi:hypothetical protein
MPSAKHVIARFAFAAAVTACGPLCSSAAFAEGILETTDALDVAVAFPDEKLAEVATDRLSLYGGNDFAYDDNLYRVPSSLTYTELTKLPGIGPNPSREDYVDSIAAGADGEWLTGNRQSLDFDLRADDNNYLRNTDLDNVSSADHLAWNWGLGSLASGSIGADYNRILGGFVNTGDYSRDIVTRSDFFGATRFQLGPHWGMFGGVLYQDLSLTAAKYNDSKSRAVDLGADYQSGAATQIGFDYRYTDNSSPYSADLNDVTFDPDFREDRARALFKYSLSDKTTIDASAGYVRREYPSTAIGSFSGEIWRVALHWAPTLKTTVVAGTWRQLTADLTAQTDYYVSRGFTIAPAWAATEKITLTVTGTQEYLDYVGSNPVGVNPISSPLAQARKDTVSTGSANLAYTLTRALSFSVTAGYQRRNSNSEQFEYKDFRTDVNVIYKFFHYGDETL